MEYAQCSNYSSYLKPTNRLMKSGDLVITYERHDSMDYIYLESGKISQNKFGAFHHNDFIGKPFGSKIKSRSTSGWMYALEPTPDLWVEAIHTRTQIVNELDSSYIIANLDIYPGCKVVESGTGSGCFSVSLARAVYPNGHIYTYEYNAVRAEMSHQEFKKLGLSDIITVTCQDVCSKTDTATITSTDPTTTTTTTTTTSNTTTSNPSMITHIDPSSSSSTTTIPVSIKSTNEDGFKNVPSHSIDAVFLDLPEPWHAIKHAYHVLKPGRNICSYSPCIEQVIRTCEELRKYNFHTIRMVEVRYRPFDSRFITFENADLGRSNKNELNNAGSQLILDNTNTDNSNNDINLDDNDQDMKDGDNSTKRSHEEIESSSNTMSKKPKFDSTRMKYIPKKIDPIQLKIARPLNSMQGHTAYLTFAYSPNVI